MTKVCEKVTNGLLFRYRKFHRRELRSTTVSVETHYGISKNSVLRYAESNKKMALREIYVILQKRQFQKRQIAHDFG
jgi:hypothetical protein